MDHRSTLQALEQDQSHVGYYPPSLYELSTISYNWICVHCDGEPSCFWHLIAMYLVQYII